MRHFQKDYPFRPLHSKAHGTPIQFDAITDTIGVIKLEDSDPLVVELDDCIKRDCHGVRAITDAQYDSWQKKRTVLTRRPGQPPQREQLSAGIAQDTSRTPLKGRSDAVAAATETPAPVVPDAAPVPAPSATRGPRRTVAPAAPVTPRPSSPMEPLTDAEIFAPASNLTPATV